MWDGASLLILPAAVCTKIKNLANVIKSYFCGGFRSTFWKICKCVCVCAKEFLIVGAFRKIGGAVLKLQLVDGSTFKSVNHVFFLVFVCVCVCVN